MPKVIIAIPTYNRREYLIQSITSVLNQTFQDFEILIFDSGSDYNVPALIREFNDPRISLISSQSILSGTENFNRIFQRGYVSDYLMVFHDDDAMHPELLEREVKILDANPGTVWAGSGLIFVGRDGNMQKFGALSKQSSAIIYRSEELIRLFFKNFNLAFDSVMYRTNSMENIDKFGEDFYKWGDRPYLIHLAKKGRVAVLKEALVNYRLHPGQDSKQEAADKLEYQFNYLNFYKNNLPQPLSSADAGLFMVWSSNNAVLSALSFSKTFGGYLDILKSYKKRGFFRWGILNYRGWWYLVKSLKSLIFRQV
jgi:glycosyltransferase involved in cell wall biosynthesis